MFKSLVNLAGDVLKTAAAPIEVAADLARVVTKSLANAAETIRDEVKGAAKDMAD